MRATPSVSVPQVVLLLLALARVVGMCISCIEDTRASCIAHLPRLRREEILQALKPLQLSTDGARRCQQCVPPPGLQWSATVGSIGDVSVTRGAAVTVRPSTCPAEFELAGPRQPLGEASMPISRDGTLNADRSAAVVVPHLDPGQLTCSSKSSHERQQACAELAVDRPSGTRT